MNTVVVITGASAGVGRATAQAFARRKACIALIARDKVRLEETASEVELLGGKALIFPMDVAHAEQMESAAEEIEKKFGAIDIWINNAMTSVFSPIKEMKADDYKRVTEVTYLSYVYGTLSALKRMLPRDRGVIIQVGSALAYRGIPLQSAYCGAKHAVQGFTESIRSELIHDGSQVKITMVQLPGMNTPHFQWVKNRLLRKVKPVPPIYQPEIAADAIVWAATHYRREWYIGWPTIIAIIGDKLASGFGDWYLGKKGYDSQQLDEKEDPNRPNNLYEPVRGHYVAHGKFDRLAKRISIQMWLSRYRKWLFISFLVILVFKYFLWET